MSFGGMVPHGSLGKFSATADAVLPLQAKRRKLQAWGVLRGHCRSMLPSPLYGGIAAGQSQIAVEWVTKTAMGVRL